MSTMSASLAAHPAPVEVDRAFKKMRSAAHVFVRPVARTLAERLASSATVR
jgi:hypothetical protein